MGQTGSEYLPGLEPAGRTIRSGVNEQVVEICAGAGGQALGLQRAGFEHALAVELDSWPVATLRQNRPGWDVRQGDVADESVWNPDEFTGVDLLAGGVPCPPFSVAGKQLGSGDERDLFAWAVELAGRVRPRALLLENVRGLSMPRFAAYRQAVLDRLSGLGYVADWRLLQASDFGVPQLRPRFILVALRPEDATYFEWPSAATTKVSVGDALLPLMSANGWPYAEEWAVAAHGVAPTIVGGSKKHGGADLGPTRARLAWVALNVDGRTVADEPPAAGDPHFTFKAPRLTVDMVARIQGWRVEDEWRLAGRKTARYRQVGNAFPPPMAEALGGAILAALRHLGSAGEGPAMATPLDEPVYRALREASGHLTVEQLRQMSDGNLGASEITSRLQHLSADFDLDVIQVGEQSAYRLSGFRAFTGQADHLRRLAFANSSRRSRVS